MAPDMAPDDVSQPDHDRIESILYAALEIANQVARQAYVEQACGNDLALQAKVEQLITNHVQAGVFSSLPSVPSRFRSH